MTSTTISNIDQLLRHLPNPDKIKELYLTVKWTSPTGHDNFVGLWTTVAICVAVVAVMALAAWSRRR